MNIDFYSYNNTNMLKLYTNGIATEKPSIYGNYRLYDVVNLKYGTNNAKSSEDTAQISQNKSTGEDIMSTLSKLTNKNNSFYDKITAKSSDADAVSLDTSKWKSSNGTDAMTLQIDQVAKAQVNSRDAVKSNETSVARNSNYTFEIDVAGKTHSFTIAVGATDNNKAIQEKMAKAINDKKIGVTATVDSNSGTSKLSVSSNNTGVTSGSQFTIRDKSGNLAETMGITNTSQRAQDAVYRINNGEQKTSASNAVDLGNGITATLRKTTASAMNITFEKDTTELINNVRELVNALNSALSDANSVDGRGTNRLANDLKGMNKTYASSLKNIGITVNADGYLSIDADKMKEAASKGSLQKLFNDDYGFARRATNIANNLKTGSSYYLNPATSSGYSYSGYYDQYANMGILFDSLF